MKKLIKFVGLVVVVLTIVFATNSVNAQIPGCPAGYVCIPLSASVSQTPTSIGSVPFNATSTSVAVLSATTSIPTYKEATVDPINGASMVTMQNIYLVSAWGDTVLTNLRVSLSYSDTKAIPNALYLYDGTTLIGSVSGKPQAVDFTNLNVYVGKGRTKTLTIKADFPTTASGIAQVTIPSTNSYSTYISANDPGRSPRNVVTPFLMGDHIVLKSSYVEWKLVSSSMKGDPGMVGVASSSITGTIVLKAIAHGGAMTKPVASDFGVEFASSTAKGIQANPVISSISPTSSTVGDGDQYIVTITATLYSNDKRLGQNQSLYMVIKDVDYVITRSSGGSNTVTNQTLGIGDLRTNSVQITKSGGPLTSGYVDWKLVNSTIFANPGVNGVASSSATGSIVLRAIPHNGSLVKPQASDFNVNFVLANNTVIPVTPVIAVTPNTPTVAEGNEYNVAVTATLYSNNPLFSYGQPVYMIIKDIDSVMSGNIITNQPSNERTTSVQLNKNSITSTSTSSPRLKVSLDPGSPAMGNVNGSAGDTIVLGVYDIVSNQNPSTLKTLNFDMLVSGGKVASDIFSSVTVRTSNGPVNLSPQTHMTFDNINKVLIPGQVTPIYITATLNKGIPNGTRTYVRVIPNKDNVKVVDANMNALEVENSGVLSSNILTFITTNPAASALLWNAVKQLFAF